MLEFLIVVSGEFLMLEFLFDVLGEFLMLEILIVGLVLLIAGLDLSVAVLPGLSAAVPLNLSTSVAEQNPP